LANGTRARQAASSPRNLMCRALPILFLALAGCTTAAERQRTKMDASLAPMVGRTIADYTLSKGPSANTVDLGPNKRGFQWVFNVAGRGPSGGRRADCSSAPTTAVPGDVHRLRDKAQSGIIGLGDRRLGLGRCLLRPFRKADP
jgi:hypothetical protein